MATSAAVPTRAAAGLALAILLAACAGPFQAASSSPHAPRVSELTVAPGRVPAGCPVTLTIRFTDAEGDVARVAAYLSRIQYNRTVENRYVTLLIEPSRLAGRAGEISAVLHPEAHGSHWYTVQLEDAAGHRSNPKQTTFSVDGPLPWRKTPRCR
jgi:hypothetical protein